MIWNLTIEGNPVAQATRRAMRFAKGGGMVAGMMDTPAVAAYKKLVRDTAGAYKPPRLLEGPLRLVCTFVLRRPKSVPRRRTWCDKKPDASNLLKLLEDALTGTVWRDDAQVVDVLMTKFYAPSGDRPCVMIHVRELEPVADDL